jgi:hypothetical protein
MVSPSTIPDSTVTELCRKVRANEFMTSEELDVYGETRKACCVPAT